MDVGLAIVSAATLLDLGLSHEKIRRFLGGLLQITLESPRGTEMALAKILEGRLPALAYFGDGVNVRLVADEMLFDSKWIAPGNPAPLPSGYRPTVEIVLDLGQILTRICGTEPGA